MKTDDWHIIHIHHQYPPVQSPGILRNFYLSRALSKLFSKSTVFTQFSEKEIDEKLDPSEFSQCIRVKYSDFRKLAPVPAGEANQTVSDTFKKYWFVKKLINLRNSYPFNLYFGDGGPGYKRRIFKEIERHLENPLKTIVLSSFPPYIDHEIAYCLKLKHPGIKWVADFRDLHIEPIYKTTVLPKYQFRRNKKMLSKADLLITISNGLAEQLKKYDRPVLCIYNGIRTEFNSSKKRYSKFTISYTGSLYKKFRDPGILFECLVELIRTEQIDPDMIELKYAGRHGSEFSKIIHRYGLEKVFVNEGLVKRSTAIEIQQKSHINLLLSSSSEDHYGVLTGKFYEYLAALNPILLLINGPEDPEFKKIFTDLGAGFIHHTDKDKEKLKVFLKEEFTRFNDNSATLSTDPTKISSYFNWDKEAGKIIQFLFPDA